MSPYIFSSDIPTFRACRVCGSTGEPHFDSISLTKAFRVPGNVTDCLPIINLLTGYTTSNFLVRNVLPRMELGTRKNVFLPMYKHKISLLNCVKVPGIRWFHNCPFCPTFTVPNADKDSWCKEVPRDKY